jgi:transcriptional regulator of acetoin/glycerol metabolism
MVPAHRNEDDDSPPKIVLAMDGGLDVMVDQILRKALELSDGNVSQAAQLLGISRKTFYNRLHLASRPAEDPPPPQAKSPSQTPKPEETGV